MAPKITLMNTLLPFATGMAGSVIAKKQQENEMQYRLRMMAENAKLQEQMAQQAQGRRMNEFQQMNTLEQQMNEGKMAKMNDIMKRGDAGMPLNDVESAYYQLGKQEREQRLNQTKMFNLEYALRQKQLRAPSGPRQANPGEVMYAVMKDAQAIKENTYINHLKLNPGDEAGAQAAANQAYNDALGAAGYLPGVGGLVKDKMIPIQPMTPAPQVVPGQANSSAAEPGIWDALGPTRLGKAGSAAGSAYSWGLKNLTVPGNIVRGGQVGLDWMLEEPGPSTPSKWLKTPEERAAYLKNPNSRKN